jgi:hypothetical protein
LPFDRAETDCGNGKRKAPKEINSSGLSLLCGRYELQTRTNNGQRLKIKVQTGANYNPFAPVFKQLKEKATD